jgi:hypothetical protein
VGAAHGQADRIRLGVLLALAWPEANRGEPAVYPVMRPSCAATQRHPPSRRTYVLVNR